MSAVASSTFQYRQCSWGDLISGTKEELQSLGLAVGIMFPGEEGGPKRLLKVTDLLGCSVEIEAGATPGSFQASRHFPDWPKRPRPQPQPSNFPGVTVTQEVWFDSYMGSSQALVDAGLVPRDRLPGAPGMNRVMLSIYPDGSYSHAGRIPPANRGRVGQKSIKKLAKDRFDVQISVAGEEADRRREAAREAERAWEAAVAALPRPAKLSAICVPTETVREKAKDAPTAAFALQMFRQTAGYLEDDISNDPRVPEAVRLEYRCSWSKAHRVVQDALASLSPVEAGHRLQRMPMNADEYLRHHVLADLRAALFDVLRRNTEADRNHAFMLSDDDATVIDQAFDSFTEAVLAVKPQFDAARHAAIKLEHRGTISAGDHKFQAHLRRMTDYAVSAEGEQS